MNKQKFESGLAEAIEQIAERELSEYDDLLNAIYKHCGKTAHEQFRRHLIMWFTLGYLKAYDTICTAEEKKEEKTYKQALN